MESKAKLNWVKDLGFWRGGVRKIFSPKRRVLYVGPLPKGVGAVIVKFIMP